MLNLWGETMTCICGAPSTTSCDRCDRPSCIACCTVIPKPEGQILIWHKKCDKRRKNNVY